MRKDRILWGCLLVLGSIGMIFGRLDYFPDINIFNIIVAVILLGICIKNIFRMNFPGILFPIAFIGIIFDDQLGITAITPWTLLVATGLLSGGLSMIFSRGSKYKHGFSYNKTDWDSYKYEEIDVEDEGHIKLYTSFAGSIKYINTDKFEQADLKCSFGSMKVYFDNATLKNNRGIARIDASFCGVEIYVPREWSVENGISSSFSAVDEKFRRNYNSECVLTLVGNASFSRVEIIYI
ncbi:membrane protein [Paraclostridium ghonii]|uniref:Membrane protein n=1 Tax=Paraclostridium ghonii TaxID=29358 RepID=A0ABU0N2G4_9FIRM|nr:hypothetical protein [Paeniclostridium ghonii]MDQ0557350.1 putative membrane protein [Paeniclostridium ghonii]